MMGTIKKGILGSFSGKVGNIVGASWKGIAYIRSLPASVRNPRTVKQVTQRSKFSLVGRLLKTLNPILKVGFKNIAGSGQSTFSAAMAYNIANAVTGDYPDFEIDYPKLKLAAGPLYPANSASAVSGPGSLDFTWDSEPVNNAKVTDRVMVIASNVSKGFALYDMDFAARADGSASMLMPDAWAGDEVETYMLFASEDGTLVSDSLYTGRVTVTAA
jgi:hypothetical protein